MAVTYEDVNPSLIENTIMQKKFFDGVHRVYSVKPIEGYVLHDNRLDLHIDDFETGEPIFELGYTPGTVTVGYNYDFTTNPYELYAVLRSTVPEDQIFGNNNDHEVM